MGVRGNVFDETIDRKVQLVRVCVIMSYEPDDAPEYDEKQKRNNQIKIFGIVMDKVTAIIIALIGALIATTIIIRIAISISVSSQQTVDYDGTAIALERTRWVIELTQTAEALPTNTATITPISPSATLTFTTTATSINTIAPTSMFTIIPPTQTFTPIPTFTSTNTPHSTMTRSPTSTIEPTHIANTDWVDANMAEGLFTANTNVNGAIIQGAFLHISFNEEDRRKTLTVLANSPDYDIRIELYTGTINENNRRWWEDHDQVALSEGVIGGAFESAFNTELEWRIQEGEYTIIFARVEFGGRVRDFDIQYNISVD